MRPITASGYRLGEHTRVVGCVVNGTPTGDPPAAALRIRDLVRELGPRVLSEGDQSRRIKEVALFAQGIPAACSPRAGSSWFPETATT